MDTRIKKILEISFAIAVIIGLIVLLVFLLRKPTPEQELRDFIRSQPTADQVFTPEELANPEVRPEVSARIFAERFGSFSTESGYENQSVIFAVVTTELETRLKTLFEQAKSESIDADYYGVSTRVLSVTVESQDETNASILVGTQREEANGNPGNVSLRNQDIRIVLVRSGDKWLVSDYQWQ